MGGSCLQSLQNYMYDTTDSAVGPSGIHDRAFQLNVSETLVPSLDAAIVMVGRPARSHYRSGSAVPFNRSQ